MKRRKFISISTLLTLGGGFLPKFLGALPKNILVQRSVLVPLAEAIPQIRHGALNISNLSTVPQALPFDWLLNVHKNIFFQNGFQKTEHFDLEIISVLLQEKNGEKEALQIQLQSEATAFMWKNEHLICVNEEGWNEVKISGEKKEHYRLFIGNFEVGNTMNFETPKGQIFVEVLEGNVEINGDQLNPTLGLGLESGQNLKINALEKSRALIIVRKP